MIREIKVLVVGKNEFESRKKMKTHGVFWHFLFLGVPGNN